MSSNIIFKTYFKKKKPTAINDRLESVIKELAPKASLSSSRENKNTQDLINYDN